MRVNIISAIPSQFNSNLQILKQLFSEISHVPGLVPGVLTDVMGLDQIPRTQDSISIVMGSIYRVDYCTDLAIGTLREMGEQIVLWLHDDPYEHDSIWNLNEAVDLLITNEREALVEYHDSNAIFMPLATDATVLNVKRTDRPTFSYSFVGHAYPNRMDTMDALYHELSMLGKNLHSLVVGTGWQLGRSTYAVDRKVSPRNFMRASADSACSIYLGREGYDLSNENRSIRATIPGPRFFDVAGLGTPQIVYGMLGAFEEFIPHPLGVRYAESIPELIEMIEFFNNSHECPSQQLREIVRDRHLYRHRLEEIVRELGA